MDMPTKKRTVAAQAAARGPLREMPAELIEQLVQGPMSPSEVQDLFLSFQKAVIERAMSAEMSHHLGYKPGEEKPEGQTNERNGASGKTVLTDKGAVRIDVPRDRAGSFEPILIPKHERRFTGFDRQDHRHVCPRHERAGDPGLYRGELRHAGVTGLHQLGDRRDHGRDACLAEPPA